MKNICTTLAIALILLTGLTGAAGQSTFTPESYLQFRQEHQDYTAGQIIQDHPPQTTYYSSRMHPQELHHIPWFDSLDRKFHFTADERELLSNNYFMVTERLSSMTWSDACIQLYSSDLPFYLSSDFILSTLHNSYDAILQSIEWEFLEPNLKELLHAMYAHFPEVENKYAADERFHEALSDADLYIAVALSLADGQEWLPQYGPMETYRELMADIASEQLCNRPLFTNEERNRKLDFSQFTPRGHYVKEFTWLGEIDLENYFRAMMWLGRIDFLLTAPPENPWEPDWEKEELLRMQLGALLVNEVLFGCGKSGNLETHETIISFMVGPDDNLNPFELKGLKEDGLGHLADLFSPSLYEAFSLELNASDDYGQKIMSNFFYVDPTTSDPGQLPVSYKLLGQKFLVDSYVFSELVFDRIIYQGKKIWRPLPDPLDVIAALGNEDALALLEGEMDQYKYAANMAGLKYLIDAYDEGFWEQSLYNTWLGAIRALNPPASANGLPYFMQTTAWHQEKLNTQMTSWAELRHDNILYGKQSYTGGTGCSYPFTYVEPYPALFERLEAFALQAASFFNEQLPGQLNCRERIHDYYARYAELMEMLGDISQKELEGIRLNEDEIQFLKTMINEYMASGPYISGWYTDLFFDQQKGLSWDFSVADVHTQPTEYNGAVVGKVLHVGNGMINMGVFLAPNPCNPGQLMAFAGPVSSFHTELTMNFKRLTDQEWEDKFWAGGTSLPQRPDWVGSYLLDGQGKRYADGRSLKGAVFQGSSVQPLPQDVDYIFLFPNPASRETHLRFVLNRETSFSMEVCDLTGRVLFRKASCKLPAAEHQIPLALDGWESGVYLLSVHLEDRTYTKELIVR